MLRGLHLWRRFPAAWNHLCSTFVHQVAVASFIAAKFCLEPSQQQPLPDFPSVEAATGEAVWKGRNALLVLGSEAAGTCSWHGWAERALHHCPAFPGSPGILFQRHKYQTMPESY